MTRGSRGYPRLSYDAFCVQLLNTEDLDPIYVMLHKAQLDPILLRKWVFAYWCFYSAYTASFICEAPDYWEAFLDAERRKLPRGHERRHFRGRVVAQAVWAFSQFNPNMLVDSCYAPTVAGVMERAKRFRQFGPWIAWKVADMLERVLGMSVDFSGANLLMYEAPRQGAALLLKGDKMAPITRAELEIAVQYSLDLVKERAAPPLYNRQINIQEVETFLCKWKAHVDGHYPLFNDIREVRTGLERGIQEGSQLCERLSFWLPKEH